MDAHAISPHTNTSGNAEATERVRAEAERLGFARIGIAPAEPWPEGQAFAEWLARGYAGTMRWMEASAETRMDVRKMMPGARRERGDLLHEHPTLLHRALCPGPRMDRALRLGA